MLMKLILLFTLTPLLELALLIEFGKQAGIGATLAIVVVTGLLGAILTKNQGLGIVHRIQQEINSGQLPTNALLEAVFILTGGLLLLTPGLITDAIGFCCLLPPTRKVMKEWLKKKIQLRLEGQEMHFRRQ